MRQLKVLLAVLLCSALAQGQDAPSARTHFKDGLKHAARSELEAALHDFEAAYTLQPHYSVLYNIAQAEAALGRPAPAIRTFERYLVEGANKLSQARRDEVRELMAELRKKLGQLRIVVASPTTRVWVDGKELESQALSLPISLTVGEHSLISSDAGGPPLAQTIDVQPASITELRVAPPRPAPPQTFLTVSSNLPGVSVAVDGATLATTPLPKPLLVAVGPRTVRCSRAGYRDVTRQVLTSPSHVTDVACNLTPEPALPPAVAAGLQVRTNPADALVFVDGVPFHGAALPLGQHELRVERDGFTTSVKAISLRAGSTITYQLTLQPTEAHRRRQALATARRRTFGYVGLGAGIAFVAGGVGLFAWNGGRYDEWRNGGDDVKQLQAVSSIQQVDDAAFASMALGTGLVAAGAWLLLAKPPTSD